MKAYLAIGSAVAVLAVIGWLFLAKQSLEAQLTTANATIKERDVEIERQNGEIENLKIRAEALEDKAAAAARGVLLAGAHRAAAIDSTEHGPAAMNRRLREVLQ